MTLLHSNLHKHAVATLQRTAAAALGGLLLAGSGCSFDSAPETSGRTDPASGAGWKPSGAASGADAAIDAQSDRSEGGSGGAAGSSTRTMRPAAASTAGTPARPDQAQKDPDDLDAGPPKQPAEQPRDAGKPTTTTTTKPPEPQHPDASTPTSRCRPGLYTGTFTGSLQLIGVTLSPVTGTVRAMLDLNETGGHLELHNGRVAGVDQDGNRLTCSIAGRVNCDNFELEDGLLEDGIFHNNGSDSDTAFKGSVEAMYSEDPYSLVGTFQVEAKDSSLFTGRGTWNIILGP